MIEMELSVPEPIATIIADTAKKMQKTPEELLSDIILDWLKLDPENRLKVYVQLYKKYISDAKKLIEQGDHTQASEKIWGAAALIVKAAAIKYKNKRLTSHGELWEFVSELATEKNDEELRRLWRTAVSMHINFYEKWAPPEDIKKALEDIELFARKIAGYTKLEI